MIGIYNSKSGQSHDFIYKYVQILEYNSIQYKILDFGPNFFNEVKTCQYYIHRFIGTDNDIYNANTILPIIENHLNIKCFPNFKTYWTYEDKIKEAFLADVHNLPMAKSIIFFDYLLAEKWLREHKTYPLIFKLKSGAGSVNVVKLNNYRTAKRLLNKMFTGGVRSHGIPSNENLKYYNFHNFIKHYSLNILSSLNLLKSWNSWNRHKMYVLFQEYLPNNLFDIRVTVIGNRAYAFRRFNRKNDYRSSGSGLIDYDLSQIDIEVIKIAFDVSKKLEFQSIALDFLKNSNGEYFFCEFSYTYNDRILYNCPGYWDSELNFIQGHFWPQYFHLVDLLNFPELKQPNIL